jgi:hypothetical protein
MHRLNGLPDTDGTAMDFWQMEVRQALFVSRPFYFSARSISDILLCNEVSLSLPEQHWRIARMSPEKEQQTDASESEVLCSAMASLTQDRNSLASLLIYLDEPYGHVPEEPGQAPTLCSWLEGKRMEDRTDKNS